MTPSVVLPPQTKGKETVSISVTDSSFDNSSLDMMFLDESFVAETGVRRVFLFEVHLKNTIVGAAELAPFFDGRKAVRLIGCKYCGRPCPAEDGFCPEWASVGCVMSS